MSSQTVDVSDFVSVSVNISPLAIPYLSFGLPIVLGDSGVIDTVERYRSYSTIDQVGVDFGDTAPEYLAAETYFEQQPQPAEVLIGAWARTATAGKLKCASLSAAQALLANFIAINDGSFAISIDGAPQNISGLDFHAALTLNAVAADIQTALRSAFTSSTIACQWNAAYSRFEITSGTTGATSSVSYLSTLGTLGGSVDVSTLLGGKAENGASPLVAGIVAETPLSAAQAAANSTNQWYGVSFAASVQPSASDYLAVASYILASSRPRVFGITITTPDCMDPTNTGDLATALKALNDKRVFWQYSSSNPYAIMSYMGRAFTVNWNGNNTAITLAWKQEPGIVAENLNETQWATIQAKGGNAFLQIDNGAVMLQPGQCANGYFFDEVHGTDWFTNRVQNDLFNLFYGTTTKIPQTDAGTVTQIRCIEGSCVAAVNNGFAAPGLWNAAGFGALNQGDVLTKGYYVYGPPIATQSQADRETRIGVLLQVALKLAGAVHKPQVIININR